MTHNVYAVRDELQGTFYEPTYYKDDRLATRDFKFKVNKIEQWKFNCTDYSLFKLGTYDDETGVFESKIEKLQSGRSVVDD